MRFRFSGIRLLGRRLLYDGLEKLKKLACGLVLCGFAVLVALTVHVEGLRPLDIPTFAGRRCDDGGYTSVKPLSGLALSRTPKLKIPT